MWWLWVAADLIVALLVGGALFVGAFPLYGALEERATADMLDPERAALLGALAGVAAAAAPGVAAIVADRLGARHLATALWLECAIAATGALLSLTLAGREPAGRVPA